MQKCRAIGVSLATRCRSSKSCSQTAGSNGARAWLEKILLFIVKWSGGFSGFSGKLSLKYLDNSSFSTNMSELIRGFQTVEKGQNEQFPVNASI